jgi:O-antigen ligase
MPFLPEKASKYFPWVLTVPLLMTAYGLGVYFRGTDNILFMPTIVALMTFSLFSFWPGIKNGWKIPRSLVFVFTFLFWLYMAASVIWSSVPYNSVFFALIIGTLPLLFITFTLSSEPVKWLKIHGAAMGLSALGLSVWALIQFFFLYEEYGPRIHHPMLNPNNLAVLFNMAIFPVLALLFTSKNDKITAAYLLAAIIMFGALLVTQSRGAILSFFIAILPFVLCCYKCKHFTALRLGLFIVGAVLLFLMVDQNSAGTLSRNIGQVSQGFELVSAVDRFELWKSTFNMIKEDPWLGTGLGTFYYYYPAFRSTIDRSDGFFAHMDPLQFWQETGVLAPLLFYSLLITVLVLTIKAIRASAKDSDMRLWVMAPFSGLLALAGHTHITFHLYILIVMIPAGYLLALWFISVENVIGTNRRTFKVEAAFSKCVLIFAFLFIYIGVSIWLARAAYSTHLINEANVMMSKGELEEGYKLVKKGRKVAPDSYSRPYEYEAKYRLAKIYKIPVNPKTREQRKKLYEEAYKYIDLAIERNSATTHLWNYKALILFAGREFDSEALEEARKLLHKTLKANPMLVDARMGLAKLYQSKGETRKALEILEAGLHRYVPKTQTSVNYYIETGKLRLQLGDKKGHDQMMRAAASFANRYKIGIPK